MQFTVLINQEKAIEWGLSNSEAILFGFLYTVPSWADAKSVDGEVFYHLSKGKIIEELPLLTDKRDTAYRLLKAVEAKGLIKRVMNNGKLYVALTNKATGWNHAEKNPRVGKNSDETRKKIRDTSEKNPPDLGNFSDVSDNHDQITSDQITTDHKNSSQGLAPLSRTEDFLGSAEQKETTRNTTGTTRAKPAKTEKRKPASRETWAAYAAAYFDRYGVEPVRNARVNAQIAQFVQRVGKAEAPAVAAFYVHHGGRYYIQRGHDTNALLRDAEKLRMEWASGRRVTDVSARHADRKQHHANLYTELSREIANGQL